MGGGRVAGEDPACGCLASDDDMSSSADKKLLDVWRGESFIRAWLHSLVDSVILALFVASNVVCFLHNFIVTFIVGRVVSIHKRDVLLFWCHVVHSPMPPFTFA